MSDSKPRLRLSAAQLRPVLPVLAALCMLLALWLAWSGWQQLRDANRAQGLEQARDLAAQGTAHALQQELDRLGDRLGSSALQATLGTGDLSGAAAQLKAGWPRVEQVEILAPDLDAAYTGLPQTGFGRLAVAEAALAANAPVARIVKDDGVRLVIAAPARSGDRVAGVAYVRLPLALATQALQGAAVADDSYLALRQGNYTGLHCRIV